MAEAWGDVRAWNREYAEVRSIPSSHRYRPSQAFRRLESALALDGARVLDLGAGTGRHALHMASSGAQVLAVDISDVACEVLRDRVHRAGCRRSVSVEQGRIDLDALPAERFDVIVDSYATCHLLSLEARAELLRALVGRLRPGGVLYTSGMGTEDHFYAPLASLSGTASVAVDPKNGIAKLLQSSSTSLQDADNVGRLVTTTTEHFLDYVGPVPYRREVRASLLTA
ncbi:MAG: Methyltransferase type 11 [Actinomycetia bacterium]|nr:Methyltransferase type 11 [Actinomycetes bacterium]